MFCVVEANDGRGGSFGLGWSLPPQAFFCSVARAELDLFLYANIESTPYNTITQHAVSIRLYWYKLSGTVLFGALEAPPEVTFSGQASHHAAGDFSGVTKTYLILVSLCIVLDTM